MACCFLGPWFGREPLHQAGTDPEAAPDLQQAHSLGTHLLYAPGKRWIGIERASNGFLALGWSVCPNPLQTCPNPLRDHRPLELSEYPAHLKQHASARRRSVHALLVQEEIDLQVSQLVEEANEVLERAPKAVNAPGHHHIELAPSGILVELVEGRTFVPSPCAGDTRVFVDSDDLPARSLRHLFQFAALVLGRLLSGTYPQVQGRPFGHGNCSEQPESCLRLYEKQVVSG